MSDPEAIEQTAITSEQAGLLYGQAQHLLYKANEGMEFVDWKINGVAHDFLELFHLQKPRTVTLMKMRVGQFIFKETAIEAIPDRTTRDSFRITTEHTLTPASAVSTSYRVPVAHNLAAYIRAGESEVLQAPTTTTQRQYQVLQGSFGQFEVRDTVLRPQGFLGRLAVFARSLGKSSA